MELEDDGNGCLRSLQVVRIAVWCCSSTCRCWLLEKFCRWLGLQSGGVVSQLAEMLVT